MVFRHESFNWEKVVEEAEILALRILKSKFKGFILSLNQRLALDQGVKPLCVLVLLGQVLVVSLLVCLVSRSRR